MGSNEVHDIHIYMMNHVNTDYLCMLLSAGRHSSEHFTGARAVLAFIKQENND